LKTDKEGVPVGFHITAGEAGDSKDFKTMLDIGPHAVPRTVMAG
jgi:hypothetical protein